MVILWNFQLYTLLCTHSTFMYRVRIPYCTEYSVLYRAVNRARVS